MIDKSDIMKILALIRVNYDNKAYNFQSSEDISMIVDFWYDSLKEYPKEIVLEATKRAIQSSEFAPKLATILSEIDKLLCANEPSDTELWDKIIKTLPIVIDWRKKPEYYGTEYYGDYARVDKEIEAIFNELPDECKSYLVDKVNLIALAYHWDNEEDEILSIEKSRFFKMLPSLRQRKKSKQFMENAGLLETNDRKFIED